MYNKILVPLDGSELSECSLEQLERVAAKGGGTEVILLKVVEPIMSNDAAAWAQAGYSPVEVENRNRADAADYISQVTEKLVNKGIQARGETLFGRPAESILGYAEENKVDLILMSSHGRTGISRWAFGSVADRVVRSSKVPVLLVSAPGCRVNQQQT
jgi:nucleotide-binding universal stress UspA family protein